jgi:peroxiredoxin
MTALADIGVQTTNGEPVRLGELVERPTVLVIPRYYRCLPCRDYLGPVSERLEQVDAAGGAPLGVSVGAAHQACWLMEQRGVRFPSWSTPTATYPTPSTCRAAGGSGSTRAAGRIT